MTDWLYQGKPYTETPEEYQGFVYVIHNFSTNRFYIGQKQFWTVKKLPPLKGRVNKRHKRVGKSQFHRTILRLCKTKGELNYHEARLQFKYEVLLDECSYNGIINCKIHRNHLK